MQIIEKKKRQACTKTNNLVSMQVQVTSSNENESPKQLLKALLSLFFFKIAKQKKKKCPYNLNVKMTPLN